MMKRVVALLLLCILMGVFAVHGETTDHQTDVERLTLYFGKYEQDNNFDNGPEPIEWIVLDSQAGRALLISKYALDCLPYHDKNEDVSWNSSSLRQWLNETFLSEAFTEMEQKAVLSSMIANDAKTQHSEWGSMESLDTEDQLFVLSVKEANDFFSDKKDRKVIGTEFARSKGAKFLGFTTIAYGETDWWLRSPGYTSSTAAVTDGAGAVGSNVFDSEARCYSYGNVNLTDFCVRPVIRVKVS